MTSPVGLRPDSEGAWRAFRETGARLAAADERALAALGRRSVREGSPRLVLVASSGEAELAGPALAAVLGDRAPVPVVTLTSPSLPAFAGPDCLLLLCADPAEERELVQLAGQAAERRVATVAVAGGSRVAGVASAAGVAFLDALGLAGAGGGPVWEHPELATLLPGLLRALDGYGLAPLGAAELLAEARAQLAVRLREGGPPGPEPGSPAGAGATPAESLGAGLARRLAGTIPLVQGAAGVGAVAAARWKALVNARAKSPAFWSSQPSASSEELSGFGQLGDVTRQVVSLVLLASGEDRAEDRRRAKEGAELADEALAHVLTVTAGGSGPAAQLLDLELLGTGLALSLAAGEGVDPGPAPAPAEVRRRLYTGSADGP